ncbi:MAG: aminomethyl-transferring glycine dehydrogenase [Phycisphaerales bacterium]|nr:aminomethyl-transferring glycine dehydrogenase [Phycisphaerales bacterium]
MPIAPPASPKIDIPTPMNHATPALGPSDTFVARHIGPSEAEIARMLEAIGCPSLDALADETVPAPIRLARPLALTGLGNEPRGEFETLTHLSGYAAQNVVARSCIGMGYYDTITPPVILRNILENPGWYTQYTPYQAEISQGRLEALLNFQTMVSDLTGLPVAGASLLDEGTAAAEAMALCYSAAGGAEGTRKTFVVAADCHPQTIGVVKTRAASIGVSVVVATTDALPINDTVCGVLLQNPATDGRVYDAAPILSRVHEAGALGVVATDLLALTLIPSPGEQGADIAVGCAQRFGVPMGFGGPHAGFIAAKEQFTRRLPGRIIGVSRDATGRPALRMAIQTREQHIKRERATSNICTAQALLAIIAGMYAAYHGPVGLKTIATRTHRLASLLAFALGETGIEVRHAAFFDTIRVRPANAGEAFARAASAGYNLRDFGDGTLGIAFDETTTLRDVITIVEAFTPGRGPAVEAAAKAGRVTDRLGTPRTSAYLTHDVFDSHHSETEMLRYIFRLQGRDLSLAHSMIPLGSCTMKLNATSEMIPVTWPGFGRIHPFAPEAQTRGYQRLFADLEAWLAEITGFSAVSLQPNAGSQGEYAGLLAIRAYHESRGDTQRDICLIPESAHGTNPASAAVAGMRVVSVANTPNGDVDLEDLKAQLAQHGPRVAALMITYPSTYGVFEDHVKEVCDLVHAAGGQVYMDGANMNAQVGLCRPGDIGADVCHLNLHKTFCIPHGGGGPGMGPIGVAAHLAPFLPGHPVTKPYSLQGAGTGAVCSAAYGSASILPISWVYIALMGAAGLRKATQVAILSANYMAKKLEGHYKVLYKGTRGRVAHEFIIDARPFEKTAGVKVEDIAKRLMDYGFHAPTMSFPVPGTLMIEPTESEPMPELDRFCDAMIGIRAEIRAIEEGKIPRDDNPLRHAPHTVGMVTSDIWTHPYTREQAAFPAPWLRDAKFWPSVARIDNPYGDRNLVCVCPPMSEYAN